MKLCIQNDQNGLKNHGVTLKTNQFFGTISIRRTPVRRTPVRRTTLCRTLKIPQFVELQFVELQFVEHPSSSKVERRTSNVELTGP
jgi:hypothetical protein